MNSEAESANRSNGLGGALFIGLYNLHTETAVGVELHDVQISDNKAATGGESKSLWSIVDSEPSFSIGGGYITCNWLRHERQKACSPVKYKNVVISNNTASTTAGCLFVSAVNDLSLFSIKGKATTYPQNNQADEEVVHVRLEDNQIGVRPRFLLLSPCTIEFHARTLTAAMGLILRQTLLRSSS